MMIGGGGIAPVAEYRAAGVPVGLGCDGSASTDSASLWMEARNAMLLGRLRKGPASTGARDALEIATRGSAGCLGREGELGQLSVGAVGDLVCWPLEGVAFAGAISDPVEAWLRCGPVGARHTVVAGKPGRAGRRARAPGGRGPAGPSPPGRRGAAGPLRLVKLALRRRASRPRSRGAEARAPRSADVAAPGRRGRARRRPVAPRRGACPARGRRGTGAGRSGSRRPACFRNVPTALCTSGAGSAARTAATVKPSATSSSVPSFTNSRGAVIAVRRRSGSPAPARSCSGRIERPRRWPPTTRGAARSTMSHVVMRSWRPRYRSYRARRSSSSRRLRAWKSRMQNAAMRGS